MREKLRSEEGLTLVELLCTVAILVLLGLMLNTGLQMAMRSYQDMTAQSEVQMLLSTLSDALADDLRYATNVDADAAGNLNSYSSASYGRASLEIDPSSGQVLANGKRVLPGGAYGNGAYKVTKMDITYKADKSLFTIELQVAQKEGTVSAETEFTVRCLNGPKASSAEGESGG